MNWSRVESYGQQRSVVMGNLCSGSIRVGRAGVRYHYAWDCGKFDLQCHVSVVRYIIIRVIHSSVLRIYLSDPSLLHISVC